MWPIVGSIIAGPIIAVERKYRGAPDTAAHMRGVEGSATRIWVRKPEISTSIDDDIFGFEPTCRCHGAPQTEAFTTTFPDDPLVRRFKISRHV